MAQLSVSCMPTCDKEEEGHAGHDSEPAARGSGAGTGGAVHATLGMSLVCISCGQFPLPTPAASSFTHLLLNPHQLPHGSLLRVVGLRRGRRRHRTSGAVRRVAGREPAAGLNTLTWMAAQ